MDGKKELSNDELWQCAGQSGIISREELGIPNSQNNGSGVQVLNEGINICTYHQHEKNE